MRDYDTTRLQHIWAGMKARCSNPNTPAYRWYGARGINVCEEWRISFKKFVKWAWANGYATSLTLDRIDNDDNYSPENCRWVTMKEQAQNRRDNLYLTAFGETKLQCEWLRDSRCVITKKALQTRIRKGMSVEQALTTPQVLYSGEQNSSAKLTEEEVKEIRRLKKEMNCSDTILAHQFNVSRALIHAVVTRRIWTFL